MEQRVANPRNWAVFFGLGILLLIIGILALSCPFVTTFATVLFFGWFLVAAGIAQLIYAFFHRHSGSFLLHLAASILTIVVGVLILYHPAVTVLALTILLAAYFFSIGIFRICASLVLRFENWGWVLLNGLISLLLGILILMYLPAASIWLIGLFIGIDFIFAGFSYIMYSLYCKNLRVVV